jgi:hypothetical protein
MVVTVFQVNVSFEEVLGFSPLGETGEGFGLKRNSEDAKFGLCRVMNELNRPVQGLGEMGHHPDWHE